jgi:hypothetical protein
MPSRGRRRNNPVHGGASSLVASSSMQRASCSLMHGLEVFHEDPRSELRFVIDAYRDAHALFRGLFCAKLYRVYLL